MPISADFMNMRGVSPFLRRSGAFFMRRTFGSDRLYRTIFSLYVQTLLCSGDSPLEFFIEGTRSRTAKSLHPRLGKGDLFFPSLKQTRRIVPLPPSSPLPQGCYQWWWSRTCVGFSLTFSWCQSASATRGRWRKSSLPESYWASPNHGSPPG